MMIKNNPLIIIIFIIFIQVLSSMSYANDNYFDSKPRGWHWYENPPDPSDDNDEEAVDPLDQMNAENKSILRALYTARKNHVRARWCKARLYSFSFLQQRACR